MLLRVGRGSGRDKTGQLESGEWPCQRIRSVGDFRSVHGYVGVATEKSRCLLSGLVKELLDQEMSSQHIVLFLLHFFCFW